MAFCQGADGVQSSGGEACGGGLLADPRITAAIQDPDLSHEQVIDILLTGYAGRPALGERAYDIETNPVSGATHRAYRPAFRTVGYAELQGRVRALAMAWRHLPECAVRRGDFVALIGFASPDYAVLDMALAYAKAIPVPLPLHSVAAEREEIFQRVGPVALAVTVKQLPVVLESALRFSCIRSLIVFDDDARVTADRECIAEARRKIHEAASPLQLVTLGGLCARGSAFSFEFLPNEPGSDEGMALLIHTSGSTGQPKGACILRKALVNTLRNVVVAHPVVTVVLAPFNHMMGRDSMYSTLNAGGTAFFTLEPDMSTLFEDIRLARPTVLALFPRICEMLHQYLQAEPRPGDGAATRSGVGERSDFLGDRLRSIVVASAPILPHIRDYISESFGVPVREGYSSTETSSGGLAMDGQLNRANVIAYRLCDVPESGYFKSDRPYPRGELCVKTKFGIREYFKNPQATAALFDEEGFCRTGDIVEERGPDRIAIIDRRQDVLKLSQGEFVAVGRLGKLFEQGSPFIRQFFAYGESSRSYLLAVVYPDHEAVQKRLHPHGTPEGLKALVRAEVQRIAQENELRTFEIPRDFLIAAEPFTQENGLLSSVNKPLRPAIRARYGDALQALYEDHDSMRREEATAAGPPAESSSLAAKLSALVSATLGMDCGPAAQGTSFQQLGGDSLGAALLSLRIEKEFGVCFKGDQILGPKGTIAEWARQLEHAANNKADCVTFEGIHGRTPRQISADDLDPAKFFPPDLLSARSPASQVQSQPQTILLTGANGFLGGRVCLEWLETLSALGGKLVCVVRSSAAQSARERLHARFASLDPATKDRFRRLSERGLEVVAGDISSPRMGLDRSTYDRLADEVDAICHCGALVNHVLAYEHLFRPNVIGTAGVIEFALTRRAKAITFVSTIGVQSLADPVREDSELSPLRAAVAPDTSYASGYFTSKWAGEHLLQSVHRLHGLPVRIVRPGLILPDQALSGEMNQDDIVTRLIFSMLATGFAPGASGGQFQLDGVPVDILAGAIVALGRESADGFRVVNALNYWESGLPVDRLATWMESAGYTLERIPAFEDWLMHMTQALRRLPAADQAHSILNVVEAYRTAPPADPQSTTTRNFQDLVAKIHRQPAHPIFTEPYIHKYLDDFKLRGLLRTPGTATSTPSRGTQFES